MVVLEMRKKTLICQYFLMTKRGQYGQEHQSNFIKSVVFLYGQF